MENTIEIFEHERFGNIRIIDRNGKPWFVAKDVAAALGYVRTADAVREHCKGVGEMATPSSGGTQMMKIIPEADLFRLIMHSKLPEAEAFQDWVVEEVLPAIRERGEYAPTAKQEVTVDADSLIALVDRLKSSEDKLRYLKPKTPFGTPSRFNGRPRTSLVGPFWKSTTTTTTVTTEVLEYQRSLFDRLPVPAEV